ncbi:MAG TPA: zinc-ribbon domain-containing protein [Pyrinomonadaceae bacterium]|nr:zinc-ribbon domain-containing protein [Pyrinomonadaceae bacterium]
MFCPQCATPNADDVKFCRSCGRELEAVALILSGKSAETVKADTAKTESKTAEDWIEKRIEGVSGVTRGSILLTVSLLIGLAMAVFIPSSFEAPWFMLWIVFFGWLAVWGGIEMAYGVSSVLESKSRLRLLELTGKYGVEPNQPQLSSGEPSPSILNPSAFRSSPPMSVTDVTTRQLDDKVKKSWPPE